MRSRLIGISLLVGTLAMPLPSQAAPRPSPTIAQLQAKQCAILGNVAALVVETQERGSSTQALIDHFDHVLAQSKRDSTAITSNRVFRRVATDVALRPDWSKSQARLHIEMACLRGEYS